GADQTPIDLRGIVSEWKTVHHPGRSLGPSITRIGHESGERYRTMGAESFGRGLHEQSNFPMPSVKAECHGPPIGSADPPLCAENQEFLAAQLLRLPTHPRVLAEPKYIAAGSLQEHLSGKGQTPLRTVGEGWNRIERRIARVKQFRIQDRCVITHGRLQAHSAFEYAPVQPFLSLGEQLP